MTRSASTGAWAASSSPMRRRALCTSRPYRRLSGRAKYTNSKMHRCGSMRSAENSCSDRTPLESTTTISPGSISRTKVAPDDVEGGGLGAEHPTLGGLGRARADPGTAAAGPAGSRTPTRWVASTRTKENAPSSMGRTSRRASSRASSGASSPAPTPAATSRPPSDASSLSSDSASHGAAAGNRSDRSSATRSLSEATTPGSMPACSARAAVLVRLPLWPRAKPARPTARNTGWALRHSDAPVVE